MEFRINNILVPTDFSKSSNVALNVAIEMAKRHSATIHLLNIVKPMVFTKFVSIQGTMVNMQAKMAELAKINMIKHEVDIINNTVLKVITSVEIGDLDAIVQKYEAENNIDITVIGTHGTTGYNENYVGSNAISIIKKSNCPVLCIPPVFEKTTFDNILFPIRYVEGVVEKYDFIKPIIEKNNAKVHLLGVYEPKNNEEVYKITDELEIIKKKINNNGYLVSYEVFSTDDVEKSIIETIETSKCDLAIINATLDKKWFHFLGGNTFTDQIVNKSKVPVLSIKPGISEEKIDDIMKVVYARAEVYVPLDLNRPIAN